MRTKTEHEYFLLTTKEALIPGSDSPEQRNRLINSTRNWLWINKGEKYGEVRIETIHLALAVL